jgi:hypothetical protein
MVVTRISKNDTLVSLISHMNWNAGWKLLNKVNKTFQFDTRTCCCAKTVIYVPTKIIREGWDQCIVQRSVFLQNQPTN